MVNIFLPSELDLTETDSSTESDVNAGSESSAVPAIQAGSLSIMGRAATEPSFGRQAESAIWDEDSALPEIVVAGMRLVVRRTFLQVEHEDMAAHMVKNNKE